MNTSKFPPKNPKNWTSAMPIRRLRPMFVNRLFACTRKAGPTLISPVHKNSG